MSGMKCTLLMLFCFSQLYKINAAIKTFEKSVEVTDKELWYSYETPILTYAICVNDAFNNRRCQVIRERSPHSNETDSCDVSLSNSKKFNASFDEIGMVPLANDDVLLYIVEEKDDSSVKFVTVNFRDCKVRGEHEILTYLPIGKGKEAVKIVAFEDCYEIHYLKRNENSDHPIHAHVVIDYDGKVVDGPTDVAVLTYGQKYMRLPNVFPITKSSRNEGVYFLERRYATDFPRMAILSPDGSKRHFDMPSGNDSSSKNVEFRGDKGFTIATNENVISTCSNLIYEKLDFKCVQYNEDGNVNFKTNFIGDASSLFDMSLNIYNLPDGGILVSALHVCENCDFEKRENYRDSVVKIDANGKTVGKILVKSFDYGNEHGLAYSHSFYVNEEKEYCIRSTSFEKNYPMQSVKLITNCFVDADFVL